MLSKYLVCRRFRILKHGRLLLVLSWSWTLLLAYNFLKRDSAIRGAYHKQYVGVLYGFSLLLYPVLGWIADVRWGRYKMISRCLWFLWTVIIIMAVLCVINSYITWIKGVPQTFLFVVAILSLGGPQANILQFGIDQLTDASSGDISAFTSWYIWIWLLNNLVVVFTQSCVCSEYDNVGRLLLSVSATLAVCLDSLYGHCLIKEPPSRNPLIQIFQVLKYVWKNKYPRLRSAFTYWDDKPYTRMDVAKSTFGGPFTIEQVEDVITFFRIVKVASIASLFLGVFFIFNSRVIRAVKYIPAKFSEKDCVVQGPDCFWSVTMRYCGYCLSLVLIPLYELGLYRLFERMSILAKFCLGAFLLLVYALCYMAYNVVSYIELSAHTNTTTATCILFNQTASLHAEFLDFKWLLIPNSIYGVAVFLTLQSAIEFLCAQSPYPMKGLLFGVFYGLSGLSMGIASLVFLPVLASVKKWPPKEYSRCNLWLHLMGNVLLLILFVACCCVALWYKKRRRDDKELNEHMFAINYYDQYLNGKYPIQ